MLFRSHKQSQGIKGLWFTLDSKGELSSGSTLAKVLDYYDAGTLKGLQGKEVNLYPDPKDFLVLTICDMKESTSESNELTEKTGLFD